MDNFAEALARLIKEWREAGYDLSRMADNLIDAGEILEDEVLEENQKV